jgi:Zn-finger nucleic acid-binding protein
MLCPACQNPLTEKHCNGITLDVCGCCSGTWFQVGELRMAKDKADPDLRWMDFDFFANGGHLGMRHGSRDCPKCASAMVELEYDQTGVIVDCCTNCKGLWLDGGEFNKIVSSLQDQLVGQQVPELIKNSLLEAVELVSGPEPRASEWRDFSAVMVVLGRRIFVENPALSNAIFAFQRNL